MVQGLALGMKLALWNCNWSTPARKENIQQGWVKLFYLPVVQVVISQCHLIPVSPAQPHDYMKDYKCFM